MSRPIPNSPKSRDIRSFSVSHDHPRHATVNYEKSSPEKATTPPYWTTSWQHPLPLRPDLEAQSCIRDGNHNYNKWSPTHVNRLGTQNDPDTCVTAPLPTPPYETPIPLAPAPRSAPIYPSENHQSLRPHTGHTTSLPPSPPWNFHNMSVDSSPRLRSSSTFSQGPISSTPMPGTMSSRDRQFQTETPSATQPLKEEISTPHGEVAEHTCSRCEARKSTGIKSRFTTAVKDFFKRPTIDESRFERIEDRHWTE